MQFSIIISALFATAALAAPSADQAVKRNERFARAHLAARGCDWGGCIDSLAAETAACAAAAAEEGLNIPMDLGCLASVDSAGDACKGCP